MPTYTTPDVPREAIGRWFTLTSPSGTVYSRRRLDELIWKRHAFALRFTGDHVVDDDGWTLTEAEEPAKAAPAAVSVDDVRELFNKLKSREEDCIEFADESAFWLGKSAGFASAAMLVEKLLASATEVKR